MGPFSSLLFKLHRGRQHVPKDHVALLLDENGYLVALQPDGTVRPVDITNPALTSTQQDTLRSNLDASRAIQVGTPVNAVAAWGYLTFGTPAAGDAYKVNGTVYGYAETPGPGEYSTIEELGALLDADADLVIVVDTEASGGGVINVTSVALGESGNSIGFQSGTTAGGGTFTAGAMSGTGQVEGGPTLSGGSNGTVATTPTHYHDGTHFYFALSNAANEANWGQLSPYMPPVAESDQDIVLSADHFGKIIKLTNAAAVTVTVPHGLPTGFHCVLWSTGGSGATVSAGADVTLTPDDVPIADEETVTVFADVTDNSYGVV